MQFCPLRENLTPAICYRIKLPFAQEPAPCPGTWPSTNESLLLHIFLPFCAHLLLGIIGHTLDLLHWALDLHWLGPAVASLWY